MEEYPKKQRVSRKQVFLRFMRYVAVAVVTVWLLVIAIEEINEDDFGVAFLAAFLFFFITIPLVGFWIYSFVKAVRRRTKTDKIFLWFHIADLLLLGGIVYLFNRPPQKCDAFIMAEHYKNADGFWMKSITESYRRILPDKSRLVFEIDGFEEMNKIDCLSKRGLKKLKNDLEDLGCIGIEVNNYSKPNYSTLRFRRIGMGMWLYRLYDRPLTSQQQDSINADPCLIVYNDSTVFEFWGGVFGAQIFVGKDEFLKRNNR